MGVRDLRPIILYRPIANVTNNHYPPIYASAQGTNNVHTNGDADAHPLVYCHLLQALYIALLESWVVLYTFGYNYKISVYFPSFLSLILGHACKQVGQMLVEPFLSLSFYTVNYLTFPSQFSCWVLWRLSVSDLLIIYLVICESQILFYCQFLIANKWQW